MKSALCQLHLRDSDYYGCENPHPICASDHQDHRNLVDMQQSFADFVVWHADMQNYFLLCGV